MNQNDLAYFEFMNESLSAYEEITNELLSHRYMIHTVKEMGENVETIQESVKETIMQFIKRIFKSIRDFFRKCIDFITKKSKTENRAFIIKACEDRLKNISTEDKRSFKIKNANIYKASQKKVDFIKSKVNEVSDMLATVVKEIQYEDKYVVMNSKLPEKMMKLDRLKDELRREAKIEYNKKGLPDVTGEDIPDILYSYKSSDDTIQSLKEELKVQNKNIDTIQEMLEVYIKRAAITEDKATYIKKMITECSNLFMETIDIQINIVRYNIKYFEGILKTFSKYKLNESAYDNVEDLNPYLEAMMDDYYRSCISNTSDIDPGSIGDEDDNDLIDDVNEN